MTDDVKTEKPVDDRITVPNWWKKWSVWIAIAAAALPDILNFVLANIGAVPIDEGIKNEVRKWALYLIPIAAMFRQRNLPRAATPVEIRVSKAKAKASARESDVDLLS